MPPKQPATKWISEKQSVGYAGEQLAETYLADQGLKLIMRNFNCKLGEIDLIMHENPKSPRYGQIDTAPTLVFIEVRLRKLVGFGSASESITSTKQRKIRLAARYYLQKNPHAGACRIDVVGIDTATQPSTIEWIKNAIETDGY